MLKMYLVSYGTVFLTEMGDKTQLLTFFLAARFKNSKAIILGMLAAIALNHIFSAYLGIGLKEFLKGPWLVWITSIGFIGIGLWMLIPEDDELEIQNNLFSSSAFLTTFLMFFLGEMGDKTQIATIFLASQFQNVWGVMLASTIAVVSANIPAIYLGEKYINKIPMHWVKYLSSACFIGIGLISIACYYII